MTQMILAGEGLPLDILISFIAAVGFGLTALYVAIARRHEPTWTAGVILLCACAEITTAHILQQSSSDQQTRIFWYKMVYMGFTVTPTAFLYLAIRFSGFGHVLSNRTRFLLSIFPVLTGGMILTNEIHGLMWNPSSTAFYANSREFLTAGDAGIWYWAFITYSYLALGAGCFFLVLLLIRSKRTYGWQTSIVIVAAALAIIGSMLDIFRVSPLPPFSTTVLGLAVGSILVAYILIPLRRRDLLAVTRATVFNNISDAIIVIDGNKRILDINLAAEELVGAPASRALSRPLEQLLPVLTSYLSSGTSTNGEVALFHGSTQSNYDLRISVIQGWQGHIVSQVIVLRDITERKQAEQALHEDEQRLASIYDTVGEVIFYLAVEPDGQYRFNSVNQAFYKLTGLSSEQVIGSRVNDIIPEPSLSMVLGKYRQAIQEKSIVRWEETSDYPTGRLTGEVSVAPIFDEAGNCTHLVGSVNDITGRQQAEQAQQQSEFLFRALFEASPDAVMLIDPHDPNVSWPIIDCNAVACAMNGYGREEMIGHSIDIVNITPGSPAERIAYLKQLREAGNFKLETFHRHKNGTIFPIEVSTTLIQAGERELVMGIDRDITGRKRTEAELQASHAAEKHFSERLAVLSEVTTELSKADSLDALCRRAVELGRERLDFDRLAIWFLAEDRTTMRGTFGVDTEGRITDERNDSFILGDDYPSRSVIQDQIPLLHRKDAQLALMGQPVGRGEHVTAGLWDGESIIGYISVDNLLRQRPFSDRDCEIIRLYASALGHLISLKRTGMELQTSQAAERNFAKQLTILSETTTELSKADSLDTLCRRAVELGRERLDFDRLSIFFISEDSNSILGTFGVDAKGRITDERGDRYPIGPESDGSESNIRSILQSQIPLFRRTDAPLSLKGQDVGQGTHVFAGLWDGNTAIGYISVDNLLRQRPISDRDCEIIRLYASALGHLCSLKRAQEELRTSEERFTKSFQSNPIGTIIEVLPEGRLLDVNETFLRLTGYRRKEVIEKTSLELNIWVNPEDRIRFTQGLIEQQSLRDVESQLLKKSGENLHVLASAEIIEIAGQPHGLIMLSDITGRKRNELVQNAIYRITQAAITSERIDELYHSIHSILGELIPAENFFIALIEPDSGEISFPYYVDQVDEPPVGMTPQQGLTGYIIRTGRPLLATREDIEGLVQQGQVERLGAMSVDWMGAPLKVEGRIIGVMAVQIYTQGTHYDQEDLNLLEFVSTQVAQAIERKRMEEEIRNLSLTDDLTGLYNRRGFTLLAEQEVKLAHRIKRSMLLFFGDVDSLKTINDTHGHAQGDQALKDVSAILKETFREADIVARIGGDEFVVLAVDASLESADVLTNRIHSILERRNQQGDRPFQLTLSLGIVRYDPETPCTVGELIAQADDRMYQQKRARKGKH